MTTYVDRVAQIVRDVEAEVSLPEFADLGPATLAAVTREAAAVGADPRAYWAAFRERIETGAKLDDEAVALARQIVGRR